MPPPYLEVQSLKLSTALGANSVTGYNAECVIVPALQEADLLTCQADSGCCWLVQRRWREDRRSRMWRVSGEDWRRQRPCWKHAKSR